jgi:hypothetical protein
VVAGRQPVKNRSDPERTFIMSRLIGLMGVQTSSLDARARYDRCRRRVGDRWTISQKDPQSC